MTEKLRKTFVVRNAEVLSRLVAFISANVGPERPLAVLVTEPDSKRTLDQNALLWALMREIAVKAWVDGRQFSAEAWFEHYARKFGDMTEIALPGGEIVYRRRSTTEMGVKRFSEFIDEVRADAAVELGVELE